MNQVVFNPYNAQNEIAFRNAAFSIEAKGKSADRVSDAAAFALCCVGIAVIIKALR